MQRTAFAGLTVLDPDENLYADGASFINRNPRYIDYLLRLGAKTHRHNGLLGLANPTVAPTVAVGSGGFLPSSTTFYVGFTLVDPDGGETAVSPLSSVTTPIGLPAASGAPGFTVASGSGLPIGTYYYAVTRTDGLGGETVLSPKATVALTRSGRITLTGLNAIRSTDAATLVIYKSTGGPFFKIAETAGDTFTDDGTPCADCTIEPPTYNTTRTQWSLDISIGSAAAKGATSVRIYASTETALISPALVTELASGASGAIATSMTRTQYAIGSPPAVSLSKGGANLIDPDTELLDWHWKRSVTASGLLPAGAPGDVRLVLASGGPTPYAVGSASAAGPAGWTPLVMFGPVGPQGATGPTGSAGAPGSAGPVLNPRGAYAAGSGYVAYDHVNYQGSSYWASAAASAGAAPPGAPWVLSAQKGDPGVSEARGTVTTTTAVIASGGAEQGTVALGKSSHILRVAADRACRVRLYTQASKRTADAGRALGTDPTGDHGLALEVVLTPTVLSLDLAPQAMASNMDTPAVDSMYYDIFNMAASGAVGVTYTRQRLEF